MLTIVFSFVDSEKTLNIWEANDWDNASGIKAVIFSRPECFPTVSMKQQIFKYQKSGITRQAKEYFIQDYTQQNIKQHVHQFIQFLNILSAVSVRNEPNNLFCMVKVHTRDTTWESLSDSEYFTWLAISDNRPSPTPQLKELASTPLLLTIILLTLPGVAKKHSDNINEMVKICSTEVGLYDELFKQWFAFQANKVKISKEPKCLYDIIETLPQYYEVYAMNLANDVMKNMQGVLNENYELKISDTLKAHLAEPIHNKDLRKLRDTDDRHKSLFCDSDYTKQSVTQIENLSHLRNGCPLNFYKDDSSAPMPELFCKFLHISLLEYLVSKDVFEGLRAKLNYFFYDVISNEVSFKNGTIAIPNDNLGITYRAINSREISPVILYMLADRAKIDRSFSELLLQIVKASTQTSTIKQMSANAMTILVKSGFNFFGTDLRNVQIPGADLRGALLANVDLRGANLERVTLDQSWLVNAQLQGSNLNNVNLNQDLIDQSEFTSPFSLTCHGQFLYSSYEHQVVQTDLKTGRVIKTFSPEIKTDIGYWLFCVSNDQILLWSEECSTIFRWNLKSAEALAEIVNVDEVSQSNDTVRTSDSSISLLRYKESNGTENLEGENVIRFYELENIPALIVTVLPTTDCNKNKRYGKEEGEKLQNIEDEETVSEDEDILEELHGDDKQSTKKTILCFPWNVKRKINASHSPPFSIRCNFLACDVTQANNGLLALATNTSISIFCLTDSPKLISEFNVDFPKCYQVILKFHPKSKALVILTLDYIESMFKIVNLIDNSSDSGKRDKDIIDMLDDGELLNFGIPKSFLFNSNGTMIAIEHRVFGEQKILLWTFDIINGKRHMTLVNKIVNYSPTGMNFRNLFPPQYAFCSKNDSRIAYYSQSDPLTITITKADTGGDNPSGKMLSTLSSEERIDGVCISNDGRYGATLSTRISQDKNEFMKKNVEIFPLPRFATTICYRISHECLYGKFVAGTVMRLENIAFDFTGRHLLAVDTNFMVLVFDLCGNLIRTVNLFPGKVPTKNPTNLNGKCFHSSFQTANPVNFLLLMYYEKYPSESDRQGNIFHECFQRWDLSDIATNNWNSICKGIDIGCESMKNEIIDKTCIIDFLISSSGNWIAARDHKMIYIWSTRDMKSFRILNPKLYAKGDFLTDTKFGPKSGINECIVVSTRESVQIFRVNSIKFVHMKTVRSRNVRRVQCTPYHHWFAIVSTSDDFSIRNLKNEKILCSDLKLWYKIENCKIISDKKASNSITMLTWGTQSSDLSLSCINIDTVKNEFAFLWSNKSPFTLEAKNCNLTHSYEIEISSFKSLQKFGMKGKPLLSTVRSYIPFADLFTKCITDEQCNEIMEPIIRTGSSEISLTGSNNFISKDNWLVSVVVKKDPEKCKKACLTPHMWLLIEGIENSRRFVIKAHKQYVNKIVIISADNMDNLCMLREFATSLKANQWRITKDEGMKILLSIQDDQQRDDLIYNLYRRNCVEWCRSKLNIVDRNIGRKTFELIVFPSILLK